MGSSYVLDALNTNSEVDKKYSAASVNHSNKLYVHKHAIFIWNKLKLKLVKISLFKNQILIWIK